MTRTPTIALAATAALASLALSGCTANPCATLPPPTPQELAVVAAGAEVEREVGSTECDLIDGAWSREAA